MLLVSVLSLMGNVNVILYCVNADMKRIGGLQKHTMTTFHSEKNNVLFS